MIRPNNDAVGTQNAIHFIRQRLLDHLFQRHRAAFDLQRRKAFLAWLLPGETYMLINQDPNNRHIA